MHLCWIRNRVFRSRDKSCTNHPTKAYSRKNKKFPEKIEDKKQLERFLGCLPYASDFIKDLAQLKKSLQQKLKKELSWTWTTNDTKIVQNFKKVCKNLLVLNLPNERDDLVREADASNEHWSIVPKIKEGEKLCKYCSESFNEAECNYPTMEKEILAVIREIENFLIFLAPKPFLIRTDCKGILGLWKRIYQICKRKGDSCIDNYGLTSFSSLLNIYRDRRTLW